MSPCVAIPYGVMCYSNGYKIVVNGKVYKFEWHAFFGVQALKSNGEARITLFPQEVYSAIHLWHDQGGKVNQALAGDLGGLNTCP